MKLGIIVPTHFESEHDSSHFMPSQSPLLREFGHQLRASREARGLSLAEAAREAEVSRRYWTEAEAGRANPSLIVLERMAGALGTPLGELVGGVRRRRGERLALVGLRGAGKSTVGRRIALDLEVPFVELDARIEALAGMTLGEVFDLRGVDGFHELEAEALEQVLSEGERVVIATGGSIVDSPETFDRLRETCRTVWLRAAAEDHLQRVIDQGDQRPMRNRPRAKEELREILARRETDYSRCDHEVDTSGREVEGVVAELHSILA